MKLHVISLNFALEKALQCVQEGPYFNHCSLLSEPSVHLPSLSTVIVSVSFNRLNS